jgi:thiol-disulfide isomerase/thioredoxin
MDVRRVAKFVRHSLESSVIVLNPDKYWVSSLQILNPLNYRKEARQSDDVTQIWLIDFFAPWCPPCLRLLNELRKLPSKIAVGNDEKQLHIGTMNCEAHPTICQEEGVNRQGWGNKCQNRCYFLAFLNKRGILNDSKSEQLKFRNPLKSNPFHFCAVIPEQFWSLPMRMV